MFLSASMKARTHACRPCARLTAARYHAKRALYLGHLAQAVEGLAGVSALEWESFQGDPRRPALVLHLSPEAAPAGHSLRLLPVPPAGAFPAPRLGPDRNNLRTAVRGGSGDAAQELLPTPHYNALVLQDMALLRHSAAMEAAAAKLPCFADAAMLLRVWARQQGLDYGADGVGSFVLTALLAHLVQKGQAVRAVRGWLCTCTRTCTEHASRAQTWLGRKHMFCHYSPETL